MGDLEFYELNSDPKNFAQNVACHFTHYYTGDQTPSGINAENKEVESVDWFDFEEAEKLEWAFDHKEKFQRLISHL